MSDVFETISAEARGGDVLVQCSQCMALNKASSIDVMLGENPVVAAEGKVGFVSTKLFLKGPHAARFHCITSPNVKHSFLPSGFRLLPSFNPYRELKFIGLRIRMKAVVISLADDGAASQTRKTNLKFTSSHPDPELRENDLLVKVVASPILPSDLLNTQGNFPHTTFPRIPGRDFAGVVVQPASSHWHGKSVFGTSGPDLGFTCDGAHAEFVVVHEDAVTEIPQGLDWKQASVIGVPWTTAYIALTRAHAKKGETVLVFGAGGAVGGAVAQLAKSSLFRCRVFTAGRGDKYDVDTTKHPDLKVAKDLTFGKGPDVIVDTTGNLELMAAGLGQLSQGGRLAGEPILCQSRETRFVPSNLLPSKSVVPDFIPSRLVISTGSSSGRTTTAVDVDFKQLYRLEHSIIGCNSVEHSAHEMAAYLQKMKASFESGELRAADMSGYTEVKLEELVAAYEEMRHGTKKKFVIVNDS